MDVNMGDWDTSWGLLGAPLCHLLDSGFYTPGTNENTKGVYHVAQSSSTLEVTDYVGSGIQPGPPHAHTSSPYLPADP